MKLPWTLTDRLLHAAVGLAFVAFLSGVLQLSCECFRFTRTGDAAMVTTTATPCETYPHPGTVYLESWAGRTAHPVEVLGRCTRKGRPHYRVRWLGTCFSGRKRAGAVYYPPACAVRPAP